MKREVRPVVCDYGIYEDDKLKLILNDRGNAILIKAILDKDSLCNRASYRFTKEDFDKVMEGFSLNDEGSASAYGYKVYFDGTRFVWDSCKSLIGEELPDGVESWASTVDEASYCADGLNKKMVSKVKHINSESRFKVCICQDCKKYYKISGKDITRFSDNRVSIPNRCCNCRTERMAKPVPSMAY